jgi:large subunit ribosomal protein L18
MDTSQIKRNKSRKNRKFRVRKKLKGSAEKPRLSVSKTNKHILAQLIDDETGVTLAGFGTMSKENKEHKTKSKQAAHFIGMTIAKLAKEKNIETVVFDRGRFMYHGVVAKLADGAREAGLRF